MESAEVLEIGREAIWVVVKISFPIMIAGMLSGLLMSFVQAVTQIQEATLSFVPKMLAVFITLLIMMPFIGRTLLDFTEKIALFVQNM